MFIGVARVTLDVPSAQSLKAKRQVLRRVTDRVKAKFNAAVAEVDENDTWNRAVVGLSVIGNERRFVQEQLDRILRFIEEIYVVPVARRETEIVSFGDQLYGDPTRKEGDDDDEIVDPIEHLLNKPERSLAEAEGMGEWENRPSHPHPPSASAPNKAKHHPPQQPPANIEEAKKKARALRNPREWEK
ncbi:MAG: DUF503 family protein [Myxococcaceae bacterium]